MNTKKIANVILATLMVFMVFVSTVSPMASALLSRKGSITLHVTNSATGEPIDGVTFRLYFFATAHESGNEIRYEFVEPYDNANISIDDLQDSYLPIHLASFAVFRNLPCTEEIADTSGTIVFENLTPGIYLIVPYGNFEGYFMPSPFIINIPKYDSGNQIWEFDINATPKMLIIDGVIENLTTYITVQKKWDTDEKHPKSITVVLMRDMEEYETVQLSDSNNWYYRWDDLPKKHIWNVVEKDVPDGYTVQYESSANTVTIINKSQKDEETTTTPHTQPTTNPEGSTTPGQTTKPSYTTIPHSNDTPTYSKPSETPDRPDTNETTTKKDTLISTGQLNWPVPVLAITGLLIFSTGWAIMNLGKKETE
jgi:hypothetical protein